MKNLNPAARVAHIPAAPLADALNRAGFGLAARVAAMLIAASAISSPALAEGAGPLTVTASAAETVVAAEPAEADVALADLAQGELPPGVQSARLLPGWILPNGSRMTAMELQLEPGWKTYWRNPGDAGVPAEFNWQGSENLGEVTVHWPIPEVIDSGGMRSLGYHNRLILPIEITPETEDVPQSLALRVDLGLCETICVPGHLSLTAPEPAETPDPLIEAALQQVPDDGGRIAECRVDEIEDGLRVSASVALAEGQDQDAAALEFDGQGVWVSEPEVSRANGRLTATSDLIDESGKPFALDKARLRLTLIGADDAVEFTGC